MRLVCPNCGAEYEVSEDVIPETGRDVQCSNCGHTWFEQPGGSGEPAVAPTSQEVAEVDQPDQDAATEHVEGVTTPDTEQWQEPDPETEDGPDANPDTPPRPDAERRTIDPEVADILRQEREHEAAARQAEAQSLESQPDLGLDDGPNIEDQRAEESRRRMARLRGEDQPAGAGPAAAAAAAAATVAAAQDGDRSRRDLLPDIDEINSTLRSDGEAAPVETAPAAPAKRGGFRRGFLLIVLLAVLAALVYVFAPQISAALPQLGDALSAYTDWVDGLRLWLDLKLQGLVAGADATAPADAAPSDTAPSVTPDAPTEPEAPATE